MNGESSSVRISPKHEGVVEISDSHCLYRNRSDDDKRRKLSPLERNNTISNLEEQRELKLQDMSARMTHNIMRERQQITLKLWRDSLYVASVKMLNSSSLMLFYSHIWLQN
ncbi:hypothetical protein YC2023_012404 [Brassica napus]